MNKKLSKREKEVLELISKGNTSKEIAKQFGISARTIDAHRSSLMQKYGVRNCEHAVRIGIELGDVAADRKDQHIDFMAWMAINERSPWENYEEVVNSYLKDKSDGWGLNDKLK